MNRHSLKNGLILLGAAFVFFSCQVIYLPYQTTLPQTHLTPKMIIMSSDSLYAYMKSKGIELTDIDLGFIENRMYQNYWKGRDRHSPNSYIIDFAGNYEYTYDHDIWYSMGAAFIVTPIKYLVKKSSGGIVIVPDTITNKKGFTP